MSSQLKAPRRSFGPQTRASALASTVAFLSGCGTAVADNFDRWVTVYNKTGYTMVRFHASNVDTGVWEEDILGRDVLPSGQSVDINVDDGTGYCRYDFLAIFEDGDRVQGDGINVCEIGSYTYH